MPDFSNRSNDVEIMDDLHCAGKVLDQTLRELEFINKWLGGNVITISALQSLLANHDNSKTISVADLGCGNGEMLRIIDDWGRSKNIHFNLVGIDANPYIIQQAKKHLKGYPHIQFHTINIFDEDFQKQKYDIVIGTLFYHHFSNEQLINFFRRLKQQVSIGFIINDIHRHWLAYRSIKILTQSFSKSSMVKYDAPLSVLRAFTKHELQKILEASHIADYSIRWKWAFRWQVVAKVNKVTHEIA